MTLGKKRYWPIRVVADDLGHDFHSGLDLENDNPYRKRPLLIWFIALLLLPISIVAMMIEASRKTNKDDV